MRDQLLLVTDLLKSSCYNFLLWPLQGVTFKASSAHPKVVTATMGGNPQVTIHPPHRLAVEGHRPQVKLIVTTTALLRLLLALKSIVRARDRHTRAIMLKILALSRRANPRKQKAGECITAIAIEA